MVSCYASLLITHARSYPRACPLSIPPGSNFANKLRRLSRILYTFLDIWSLSQSKAGLKVALKCGPGTGPSARAGRRTRNSWHKLGRALAICRLEYPWPSSYRTFNSRGVRGSTGEGGRGGEGTATVCESPAAPNMVQKWGQARNQIALSQIQITLSQNGI